MKKTVEFFIHLQKESYETEYRVEMFKCNMTEYGYILIGTKMIDVDMPSDDELNALHIKTLKAKATKLDADFYVAKEKIENEIQALLSIANKAD